MISQTAFLAACVLWTAGSDPGVQTTSVQQVQRETYTFQRPLLNGRGVQSLQDFSGTPVLIGYWSHRCPPCTGFAVPDALRLQREFGSDIQVILSEAGGATDYQMSSFALWKGWFGTEVMWTTEQPTQLPEHDLPSFVLLTGDGEMVLSGETKEHLRDIEDQLESMLRDQRKPPKDLPKELGKAWVECNEGNFAKAQEIALDVLEESAQDGLKREAAERMLDTIRVRLDTRFKRMRWMMDNGYPIEATEMAKGLKKGIKGMTQRELDLKAVEQELDTPEMKLELEAQKALARIERRLYEDPHVRYVKQLKAIVEKYPTTKTAVRASKLAKVAAI